MHFELYQDESRENAESSERLLSYLQDLGYSFFHEGDIRPFDSLQGVIEELKPLQQCVNVVAIARKV